LKRFIKRSNTGNSTYECLWRFNSDGLWTASTASLWSSDFHPFGRCEQHPICRQFTTHASVKQAAASRIQTPESGFFFYSGIQTCFSGGTGYERTSTMTTRRNVICHLLSTPHVRIIAIFCYNLSPSGCSVLSNLIIFHC
jgi:hypothetical protein